MSQDPILGDFVTGCYSQYPISTVVPLFLSFSAQATFDAKTYNVLVSDIICRGNESEKIGGEKKKMLQTGMHTSDLPFSRKQDILVF